LLEVIGWARPISTPPFYAYPIISGVCFTYGGVKTNSNGQVVDTDGRAIPGLYAAGEATGLYYQVYTGATSVMRGAVFGKIAGAHAAGVAAPCRRPGLPTGPWEPERDAHDGSGGCVPSRLGCQA
jgi:tricarballylate dehydrogenase